MTDETLIYYGGEIECANDSSNADPINRLITTVDSLFSKSSDK